MTAYVLVEYSGDQVAPVTGELITAARVFGDVCAVVVGTPGAHEPLVAQLAALGAAQVFAAECEDYDTRVVLPAVDALHALAAQTPAPIVVQELSGLLVHALVSLLNYSISTAERTEEEIFHHTVEEIKRMLIAYLFAVAAG